MLGLLGKLFIKALGGTRNDRIVRSRLRFVREKVNPLEEKARALSDEALLQQSLQLRERRGKGEDRAEMLPWAFALIREASRRAQNHRQYDVQLVAGMVLDQGWIAEEATGEGKTIACYPAIYMAWLDGMKVHVVTVNDYLVQRDAEFAKPVFAMLGATVGFITADMPAYGQSEHRRNAYLCDVTYGTNAEFGFDYLRDNMKTGVPEQVQGRLDFAIVDEVDNILIDEARTPLIISGPSVGDASRFRTADEVARKVVEQNRPWERVNQQVEGLKRQLKELQGELGKDDSDRAGIEKKIDSVGDQLDQAEARLAKETKLYEVEMDKKSAHMTHEGTQVAQDIAKVGSFYVGANMEWPHLLEQSLRAHLVFERDKDYVVRGDEIIIVDEFTGRLMEGRQWSDGLHQAVEAKERVRVKEETQTLATITLQNFFKLYKKLAGMTGTAMTEAGEFMKIYKLDMAAIATNRPVNRIDHNDRIYADVDSKFTAIVEEINNVSKAGRPVLVGTTSIEKSEHLSKALIRSYGIEHQVLNARPENAAREADIVKLAGTQHPLRAGDPKMVGTVTIATNMAGRGTDIKLGPGVVWEPCRMPAADKLHELGVTVEPLFPPGSTKCCIHCPQYNPSTKCAHCYKPKLDKDFPERGRMNPRDVADQTRCPVKVPCGLHIVGTERHEARRIDNQLRGRAGRQGDPGSSRFFLSLRDDLMSIFAGEWTLKVLGWLGLSGDQAIEDKRVSKGIERAQKKVEERNFETRKNLLEYDEVMDYQRKSFYGQRQSVLEGRDLEGLVRDMIRVSLGKAVATYLSPDYPKQRIADWAKNELQVELLEGSIKAQEPEDLDTLQEFLRDRAIEEALANISTTTAEYIDEEAEESEWDLKGLNSWAMSRFRVDLLEILRTWAAEKAVKDIREFLDGNLQESDEQKAGDLAPVVQWAKDQFDIDLSAGQLAKMDRAGIEERIAGVATEKVIRQGLNRVVELGRIDRAEVEAQLGQAATEKIHGLALSGVARFLAPDFGRASLAEWARIKFLINVGAKDLEGEEADARELLMKKVDEAYRRRLIEYPVEQTLAETVLKHGPDNVYALTALATWANGKFELDLTPEKLREMKLDHIRTMLVEESEKWQFSDRLEKAIYHAVGGNPKPEEAIEFAKKRFDTELTPEDFDGDVKGKLLEVGRGYLRREMDELERFVVLNIFDGSWKDHLLAIDHLKNSIGLRGYAEQDPKVAFKREGARLFLEMLDGVREKVTDMVFKVRLTAGAQMSSVYRVTSQVHEQLAGYDHLTQDMATQAQQADGQKVKTITRDTGKVGRNDPCPCGSGKKYKKCHGRNVA